MTHEEKLAEAKRLYATANADQRYVLESLFPELKESEDEKIRKAIIKFLIDVNNGAYKKSELEIASWLAWLEKQGKQKPAWSEEDEHHWMMCLECVEECAIQEREDFSKTIDWLKSLKQRMEEQK